MVLGSQVIFPLKRRHSIAFLLLWIEAMAWIYFVFLSPPLSHRDLEFCAQYFSFRFIHCRNSSCACFRSCISSGERSLMFASASIWRIFSSMVAIWSSIRPNSWLFQDFRFVYTTLILSRIEPLDDDQEFLIVCRQPGWVSQQSWNRKGRGPQLMLWELTRRGQWSESDRFRRETLMEGNKVTHSGWKNNRSILLFYCPLNQVNQPFIASISTTCSSCKKFWKSC